MRIFVYVLPALVGCATVSHELPPPRPLGREIEPAEQLPITQRNAPLSLRDAISFALARNPQLAIAKSQVKRQAGHAAEAGVLPNPELTFEIEDFGGTGPYSRLENGESTLQVSQHLEIGGARRARLEAAAKLGDAAAWRYEATRLAVISDTMARFAAVMTTQRALEAANEAAAAASAATQMVADRIEAGRSAPVELFRARTAQSKYDVQVLRMHSRETTAKAELAAMWAGVPPVENVIGYLEEVTAPPSFDSLAIKLEANPLLSAGNAEVASGEALIRTAKREQIPWVRLSGGYRDYAGDDHAFVAGITLPLPIFDQNRGKLAVAEAQTELFRTHLQVANYALRADLKKAHQAMAASYTEIRSYQTQILPDAEKSAEAFAEGFRLGKFGQLDVVNAQQAALEAKLGYLDALATYHQAAAEIQRLTGEPLLGLRY